MRADSLRDPPDCSSKLCGVGAVDDLGFASDVGHSTRPQSTRLISLTVRRRPWAPSTTLMSVTCVHLCHRESSAQRGVDEDWWGLHDCEIDQARYW